MDIHRWLTDEWKQCWKWFQVQLGVIIAIAPQIYDALNQMQDVISPNVFRYAMTGLGVLVIINSVRKKIP